MAIGIDNSKYKAQFGTKAKMLSPEEVERIVFPACGSGNIWEVCENYLFPLCIFLFVK